MAAMSRLNFMEEQELAIRAIAQELAQLEQLVRKGEPIAPENALLFDICIEQAVQLRNLISKQPARLPLQTWMRHSRKPAAAVDRRRRSGLFKRA